MNAVSLVCRAGWLAVIFFSVTEKIFALRYIIHTFKVKMVGALLQSYYCDLQKQIGYFPILLKQKH